MNCDFAPLRDSVHSGDKLLMLLSLADVASALKTAFLEESKHIKTTEDIAQERRVLGCVERIYEKISGSFGSEEVEEIIQELECELMKLKSAGNMDNLSN